MAQLDKENKQSNKPKTYVYNYVDRETQQKVKDYIEAESEHDAITQIRSHGKFLIDIKPVGREFKLKTSIGRGKVDKKTMSLLFSQLSFMRAAGLGMSRSLDLVMSSTQNKALKESLKLIYEGVNGGKALSVALEEQPNNYPPSVYYQVKSGESSGELDRTMMMISETLTKEVKFASGIKSALTYPCMVIVVTIGIVYFLMTKVVPSMSSAIAGMGGELPLITKIVMKVSDIISTYGGTFSIFTMLTIATFILTYVKVRPFKFKVDHIVTKLPYVGSIITRLKISRFCRLMNSLLNSGVDVVSSLKIVKNTLGNLYIEEKVEKTTELVETNGMSLSLALKEHGELFPSLLIQLVEVGTESGTLPEVLELMANNFEEEVDDSLRKVLSLLDTVLILIIGAIVGTVVVSMFLPMFSFMNEL